MHLGVYMQFSEDDGIKFVQFTDEVTCREYKVRCDAFFFHVFSANSKGVPREAHGMLTKRGKKAPTIVLGRFLGVFRVCVLHYLRFNKHQWCTSYSSHIVWRRASGKDEGELVPAGMWLKVGGEKDMVRGRCTLLIADEENEQRYAEKMAIDQALQNGMALFNPFKMHGKETKLGYGPYNVCVEWVEGPLGPKLKVNPARLDAGENRITERHYGDSTALPHIIRWDAKMLCAMGATVPSTYTVLLQASRHRSDCGQCFSFRSLHSCLHGACSKIILLEPSIPAGLETRRRSR